MQVRILVFRWESRGENPPFLGSPFETPFDPCSKLQDDQLTVENWQSQWSQCTGGVAGGHF